MHWKFIGTAAVAASAFVATSAAQADTTSFSLSGMTDDNVYNVEVDVLLTDVVGGVEFDLAVDGTAGSFGDLRGFFFTADGVSFPLTLLDGADINAVDLDGSVSQNGNGSYVGSPNNNVPGSYNAGVEIGTQGAGTDFVGDTTFTLGGLTVADLLGEQVAVRVMSVGPDFGVGSSNSGSIKLIGGVPVPEPAALGGIAMGALVMLRRRRA